MAEARPVRRDTSLASRGKVLFPSREIALFDEIALVEHIQYRLAAGDLDQVFVDARRNGAAIEHADQTIDLRDLFAHHPHRLGHMTGKPLYAHFSPLFCLR